MLIIEQIKKGNIYIVNKLAVVIIEAGLGSLLSPIFSVKQGGKIHFNFHKKKC